MIFSGRPHVAGNRRVGRALPNGPKLREIGADIPHGLRLGRKEHRLAVRVFDIENRDLSVSPVTV